MNKDDIIATGLKMCLRDILAIFPNSKLGELDNIKHFINQIKEDDRNNHLYLACKYVYEETDMKVKQEIIDIIETDEFKDICEEARVYFKIVNHLKDKLKVK